MKSRAITENEHEAFNRAVAHPLQSFEWGEFRRKTGIKVIRRGFFAGNKLIKAFTLTIHKIPHTPFTIGYLPKGDMPTGELLEELSIIGKQEKCIFIQLEPNEILNISGERNSKIDSGQTRILERQLRPSARPLFTKYTFVLDLTKSEDELLKNMHPKARYNIKIAQKRGVEVVIDNSEEAFRQYWRLMEETTSRQKFYAHTQKYHRLMWETLGASNDRASNMHGLTAHLLTARYNGKVLTAWIIFVFKDTLYYPYGASSSEHREVMASNLIMWEAIRFGKKHGLKKFDLWGALGPDPDPKDPWSGFHNFKQKYAPDHIEFIGSYDLVVSSILYEIYKLADKARWVYLKLKKR